jgi:hypothetical protein
MALKRSAFKHIRELAEMEFGIRGVPVTEDDAAFPSFRH